MARRTACTPEAPAFLHEKAAVHSFQVLWERGGFYGEIGRGA